MNEGYDVVYGVKKKDASFLMKFFINYFISFIQKQVKLKCQDNQVTYV